MAGHSTLACWPPSPAPRRRDYGADKDGYLQASRLLLPHLPPPIERAAGSRRRLAGPRMLSGMTSNTRARFEVAIDGRPRAWYGDRAQAIEAALSLKAEYPSAGVTVRDVENGEMLVILRRKELDDDRGERP